MSYRRSMIRLLKYGAVGGFVATGVSFLYLPEANKQLRKVSERFTLHAKSEDVSRSVPLNNLYHGRGTKWDNDWDCRYGGSQVGGDFC